MTESVWTPRVAVSCIAERDGRYLMIREIIDGVVVINQPAGHLERDESLLEAVIRETREETQYDFTPTGLVGIYRSIPPANPEITYLRILISGDVGKCFNGELDDGIIAVEWMTYDEIRASQAQHRSPLVMLSLDDYLSRPPAPLDIISRVFA